MSSRAAAQRFGVGASSAIWWRAVERREGDVRPKRQAIAATVATETSARKRGELILLKHEHDEPKAVKTDYETSSAD